MVTIEEDVKVIRVGNSLRVAIPSVICKALRIEEGDTLHVKTTDGEVLLRKLESKRGGTHNRIGKRGVQPLRV